MIPRLANRTPPMRPMPGNTGEPGLENLAAAFALLTQRRALAIQHIRMLDQQRFAAVAGLVRLQKRIAWLMRRIDALSPDLRDPAGVISADPPRQEPQDEQPGREPTEHRDAAAAAETGHAGDRGALRRRAGGDRAGVGGGPAVASRTRLAPALGKTVLASSRRRG